MAINVERGLLLLRLNERERALSAFQEAQRTLDEPSAFADWIEQMTIMLTGEQ